MTYKTITYFLAFYNKNNAKEHDEKYDDEAECTAECREKEQQLAYCTIM